PAADPGGRDRRPRGWSGDPGYTPRAPPSPAQAAELTRRWSAGHPAADVTPPLHHLGGCEEQVDLFNAAQHGVTAVDHVVLHVHGAVPTNRARRRIRAIGCADLRAHQPDHL